ncbi:MAG TPA: hypothetical protein VFF73_38475 [Planctomycetota bacterium]|nr:hypothetical protein [Planctomycetota bacterium]
MSFYISKLWTTAGYLELSPIEFADGLNAIIGGPGRCKSTVCEFIRFVGDCDPARIELLRMRKQDLPQDAPRLAGLVRAALNGGVATIELVFRGPSKATYTIERTADADEPAIFKDGAPTNDTSVLDQIEIYSQGDLQQLAQQGARRLDLVDRPIRSLLEKLKGKRQTKAAQAHELSGRIKGLRQTIDSGHKELRNLAGHRERLETLRTERQGREVPPELEVEHKNAIERKRLFESAQALATKGKRLLDSYAGSGETADEFREAALAFGRRKEAGAKDLASAFSLITDLLDRSSSSADGIRVKDMAPMLVLLKKQFDEADVKYEKLRREQRDLQESLSEETKLSQEIARLEELEKELKKQEKEVRECIAERDGLRKDIRKLTREIFEKRQEQVATINSQFEGLIELELREGGRNEPYKAQLDALISGSKFRGQAELARDLAAHVLPWQLIDAVEEGDVDLIANLIKRPREQAQIAKVLAYMVEQPTLYDLETLIFDDEVEIKMFIDKEWKSVRQLSPGQLATAILPLIVRGADYPLIVDQPEDDLENSYIFEVLVKRVRELKLSRQLIFVTHNANIPVNGEADRVIVMQTENPPYASRPIVGTVDEVKSHILRIMEGGPDAFMERQRRYGKLVEKGENGGRSDKRR